MAFAGDAIITDAVMIYDQFITVHAEAADIFPWLQQLGKNRGGWYLPLSIERLLPEHWRASRQVKDWHVKQGDRVEDYGFDDDYFIVESIDPPSSLVYSSTRYGCRFTWALLTHESGDNTIVHLRFRGRIEATGLKRWLIVQGGGFMDWLSTRPMLNGLKERVEKGR